MTNAAYDLQMGSSPVTDQEAEYIDLRRTAEQFGEISVTRSKVVSLCRCGENSTTTLAEIRRAIKKHGSYACLSCRSSDSWKKGAYRQKQEMMKASESHRSKMSSILREKWTDESYRDSVVRHWEDPGRRARQSARSRDLWQDKKYRAHQLRRMNVLLKDEEFLLRLRESNKKRWSDQGVRDRHSLVMKGVNRDSRYKSSQSDGLKRKWRDPEYVRKQREYRKDPNYLAKLSLSSSSSWDDPSYRLKQAKAHADWLSSGKDSIIEKVTQRILDQLQVPFERHFILGPYTFDLFVPGWSLLIECQGEYWHSLDNAKSRDTAKFSYVDRYFPGHRLIYLFEREFLNPGIVKQKLINELFGSECTGKIIDFSLSDLEIRSLSVKEKSRNSYYSLPEEFLQSFHYAGFGRSAKLILGAFLNNQLVAVCKFSSVVRKEVSTSLGLPPSKVWELDRFCIHPNYQKKNLASWFLSRCVKQIGDARIQCLVSFADSTFGHDGTIYKAANWTRHSAVKPSYHYVDRTGWVLHKKTLWDHAKRMGKTERSYAEEHGYQKIYGKEKEKFVLRLS